MALQANLLQAKTLEDEIKIESAKLKKAAADVGNLDQQIKDAQARLQECMGEACGSASEALII